MNDVRRDLHDGRIELPRIGLVQRAEPPAIVPYVVVVAGDEVEPIASFLSNLVLSDVSPLTVRSYAHDLLRWWKILSVVEMPWERASRAEVEVMVGWLRSAPNPQRRRSDLSTLQPGSVNPKTEN